MKDDITQPPKHLATIVGSWATEATHVLLPDVVVHGETEVEWLEGERFLVMRSRNEHPDFPDGISIIGHTEIDRVEETSEKAATDALHMYYFDSRGVHRVYETRVTASAWEIWRDAPGFSQTFEGRFQDGGDTIVGLWKLAEKDEMFKDDLRITYRRSRS